MGVDLLTNRAVSCSCLPACFEIAYTKVSTTAMLGDGSFNTNNPIFLEKSLREIKYFLNYIFWEINFHFPFFNRKSISVLHIYFIETAFHSSTKGELIGFTEFLCELFQELFSL